MIADLRRAAQDNTDFPPVLLVHLGNDKAGERFLADRWPGVPAIADPDALLYKAVELSRMKLRAMLAPVLWGRGLQAFGKGHFVGRPIGDPARMPGLFLVDRDGRALWSYRSRHLADHPDLMQIPRSDRSTSDQGA